MHAADEVDPEVAEVTGVATRESAHERHRYGHADGRGDEVLHGEAGHLDEMALGGLTGIGLPVRVGDEADGGVPGERRGHRRGGVVEVQRQPALHQLQEEQEQHAHRREGKHAARVRAPRLFRLRVGPDQSVDDALTSQILGGGVDAIHVVAQRHVDGRQADDQRCEEQDPRRLRGQALTRTSPGRAGRRRETGRAGSPARGRSGSGSQSLDQLLYPAEQGEDRHRQHDVDQDRHVTPGITGRRISTT